MTTLGFIQYSNPDYYPFVYRAARILTKHDFRIEILCRQMLKNFISSYGEKVSMTRIGPSTSKYLQNIVGAGRWMTKGFLLSKKWDGVIGYDLFGGILAAKIAQFRKIPFLFHCHDFCASHEMRRIERRLWKQFLIYLKKASRVTFPSKEKANFFRRETEYAGPIEIVANSPLLRKKLPRRNPNSIFRLHYQGSIHRQIGLDKILEALPELPQNVHFTWMGPSWDGFRADLINRVKEKKLESRVRDLGEVSHLEILSYTDQASVGLYLPVDKASIHLHSGAAVCKLNEYLAAGIPALVSPLPALERWAEETKACLVVDPKDKNALQKTILKLYERPEDYHQLSESAFKAHQEIYHFEKQFLPILNYFESYFA